MNVFIYGIDLWSVMTGRTDQSDQWPLKSDYEIQINDINNKRLC